MMERISVVGLGKLGACSAACLASKGFDIIGIDTDEKVVSLVNAAKAPVREPGLAELMSTLRGRFTATGDYASAIRETDCTFIIVPTPSLGDGTFSDEYVCNALWQLSLSLRQSRKPYHLFVITSTVSPGTTEGKLVPLIEQSSGRKLNEGFGVCYSPEFIALGTVIRDFLNPDMVLIGESDDAAGKILAGIYRKLCDNQPAVCRMSIVSAEVAKISLNSYVTMKISFANTLAAVCEAIPGADIDAITRALGADRRIGPAYLRGGASYGGPCFPRDNRAFAAFATKCGAVSPLARATDEVNDAHIAHITGKVRQAVADPRSLVAVLGAAYKPGTVVIEESAGVKLTERLLAAGHRVVLFDPLALEQCRDRFHETVAYARTLEEAVRDAEVCVIMTPDNAFRTLTGCALKRGVVIVDCWRLLAADAPIPGAVYLPVGRHVVRTPGRG